MTFAKNDILTSLELEKKRLLNHYTSNQSKQLQAVKIAKQIALTLDDDKTLTIEPPTKPRDFKFFNLGSFVEQAVKSKYTKTKNLKKSTSTSFDTRVNKHNYEIKSSLSSSSLSSCYNGKSDVLLVNSLGVWVIPKEIAIKVIDKKGQFSATDRNGTLNKELTMKLGFEI